MKRLISNKGSGTVDIQAQESPTSKAMLCPALCYKMEKAMAPHSSTLAWRIPWMEEPGRLQSMGSWRVGHDWATSLSLFTFMHWRRQWQPTPVFLPGEPQGWQSLVGCCLWGCTESDTTDATAAAAALYKKSRMAPCSWTQSLFNFLRRGHTATPGLLRLHHTNQGFRWWEVVGH